MTRDLPGVFDAFVKAYQSIGEYITYSDSAWMYLSQNLERHFVLPKICANILEMLVIVLRILSIPLPILDQTFKSSWDALSPQWEQFSQDLQWLKKLVEEHRYTSMGIEYELRRQLVSSGQQTQSTMTKRRLQWVVVQEWLAGIDNLQKHRDVCNDRSEVSRSGDWLLGNPKYIGWRFDDVPQMPILWLNGILGAGKTILASKVIDDCRDDKSTSLCTAFFYCQHDGQNFMSILRSLIAQLLVVDHILLPWCHEQYTSGNRLSLIDEKVCRRILNALLMSCTRTFIVIDGLDECEFRDRRLLLSFFDDAISTCERYDPGKLRVMFVSRDELDIRKGLRGSCEISVTSMHNGDDMKRFVKKWCDKIRSKFRGVDQEILDYIRESTLHRADGKCQKLKQRPTANVGTRNVLVCQIGHRQSPQPDNTRGSSRTSSSKTVSQGAHRSVSASCFLTSKRLIFTVSSTDGFGSAMREFLNA